MGKVTILDTKFHIERGWGHIYLWSFGVLWSSRMQKQHFHNTWQNWKQRKASSKHALTSTPRPTQLTTTLPSVTFRWGHTFTKVSFSTLLYLYTSDTPSSLPRKRTSSSSTRDLGAHSVQEISPKKPTTGRSDIQSTECAIKLKHKMFMRKRMRT